MIVRILNKLEAKLKSSEIARFLVLTLINLLLFVIAISLSISVGFLLFMNNFTTNFINFIMEWSSKHKNDLLLYGIVFLSHIIFWYGEATRMIKQIKERRVTISMNKIILKIKRIKNKIVENVSNHILENHILNANYKGFRVTPEMNSYVLEYDKD